MFACAITTAWVFVSSYDLLHALTEHTSTKLWLLSAVVLSALRRVCFQLALTRAILRCVAAVMPPASMGCDVSCLARLMLCLVDYVSRGTPHLMIGSRLAVVCEGDGFGKGW